MRGRSLRGNPCVVFEALSLKQVPKFRRKTFAEAAAEGGSKKDYKRYSRKGFAEGVVSVMKLYKNRNHRSTVRFLTYDAASHPISSLLICSESCVGLLPRVYS